MRAIMHTMIYPDRLDRLQIAQQCQLAQLREMQDSNFGLIDRPHPGVGMSQLAGTGGHNDRAHLAAGASGIESGYVGVQGGADAPQDGQQRPSPNGGHVSAATEAPPKRQWCARKPAQLHASATGGRLDRLSDYQQISSTNARSNPQPLQAPLTGSRANATTVNSSQARYWLEATPEGHHGSIRLARGRLGNRVDHRSRCARRLCALQPGTAPQHRRGWPPLAQKGALVGVLRMGGHLRKGIRQSPQASVYA